MKSTDPVARLLQHTVSISDDQTVAPDYAVGRIASRTMDIGAWRMRLPEAEFVFSPQARDILGLEVTDPMPVDKFLMRFTKQGRLTAAMLIKGALEEKRGFRVEADLIDFHNHVRVLEFFGDVEFNPNGSLAGIVGTVRDVSAVRQAENLATSRMMIIKTIMKHAPMAIAILDRKMTYLAVSDHWVSGHGFAEASDLIGKCHYDVFDIPENLRQEHRQVLAGTTLLRPRNFLKDKDGNAITQTVTLAPWYERPGEIGGMAIMMSKIDPANAVDPDLAIDDTPKPGDFDNLLKEIAA